MTNENPFSQDENKPNNKKTNPFDKPLLNDAEEKEIPYTTKQQKSTFPHEKYKTVRIKPDDFKTLKNYAFFNDMAMVDVISLALKSLDGEEKKS